MFQMTEQTKYSCCYCFGDPFSLFPTEFDVFTELWEHMVKEHPQVKHPREGVDYSLRQIVRFFIFL